MLGKFFKDNPNVVLCQCHVSEGIAFDEDEFMISTCLVTTRKFHPTEVIELQSSPKWTSIKVEIDNKRSLSLKSF